MKKYFIFFLLIAMQTTCHFDLAAQKLEAAYSEWDDQFDEWKIHVNEDVFVLAIRQFGTNPLGRWNFTFEDGDFNQRGNMQMKWVGDLNYYDFFMGNEQLNITTVYRNDPTVWRIQHGDQHMIIQMISPFEWKKRNSRDFSWHMYLVDANYIQDWYIDDSSEEQLTFEMRVAASLIVIESAAFIFRN